MDPFIVRLVIFAFLIAIIYNLGAALYYMMNDKGTGKRMAWALTRRVGLSVALILLIALGIVTGVITPHGPPG